MIKKIIIKILGNPKKHEIIYGEYIVWPFTIRWKHWHNNIKLTYFKAPFYIWQHL